MPVLEAPSVELGSAPENTSVAASPSQSDVSSASSPEPPHPVRPTHLFRALAMPPPEPDQPPGQDELERRLPGYRRIVIPRELTLIELLKQCSGVGSDEEVLRIRDAKLRVVAERVGLRRLDVLAPRLRSLTLDGSVLSSLRDLGIGLVHLKMLSVNRCNLTSLDGVWGLGSLRELSAAGNRVRDLQPLAALQRLHTLNVSDNPITESGRIWTLGVCGSLRRLTLTGTPVSDTPNYRSQIASALPMLVYLDERPLHNDVDYDSEGMFGLSSESEQSDAEETELTSKEELPSLGEPDPGPSTSTAEVPSVPLKDAEGCIPDSCKSMRGRRPASSACVGERPPPPALPPRPATAQLPRRHPPHTQLHILNTLLDDEWRCSGSKLTSEGTVCGNLTRALRRSTYTYHRHSEEAEKELIRQTLEDATRSLASEIPRAPKVEDWLKFKEETGIDINIDFTQRPGTSDPLKAIERLEQIEKETMERFNRGDKDDQETEQEKNKPPSFAQIMDEFNAWKTSAITPNEPTDMYSLFSNLNSTPDLDTNQSRYLDNSESRSD